MNGCLLFLNFFKVYWKSIFVIIYPCCLLPIILLNNIPPIRCLYIILLMSGYWVFEVIPLPVTSLIPMVLFPTMGVLDSDKVSLCYFKEANMMFVGGLILAIAVEYCNLHIRIALYVIKWIGCSPRRLNLGLVTVTMFISMWISNTAATAMMIPIIEATLQELESQGIGEMFVPIKPEEDATQPKKPTRTTMCYYISTAYASGIGGTGSLIGTGTNLTYKGVKETRFTHGPGVEFVRWMMISIPIMLVTMYLSLIWMQFWFMGLFRPKSKDARSVQVGKEGAKIAKDMIKQKISDLGPMTFHEKAVAFLFILAILLWIFRKPEFIPGWAEFITTMTVKDASAAFLVVILIFIIPEKPDFIHICNQDETIRPKTASKGLLTWKVVHEKLPWGLIFLLGGGFSIAEASRVSGMSQLIAEKLQMLSSLPHYYVLIVMCLVATALTQIIGSNVAIANILLPVVAEMAVVVKIHPTYLMYPVTICCSYAFCLPVSTPSNAIVSEPANITSLEMVKVGVVVAIIAVGVLLAIFPFYAPVIMKGIDTFPDWATKYHALNT